MLTRLQARALLVILLGAFALLTPPPAPAAAAAAACTGQQVCYDQFPTDWYCSDPAVAAMACDGICPNPGGPPLWSWYSCDGWCPHQAGFLITCYP